MSVTARSRVGAARALQGLALVASVFGARPAHADPTKDQCVEADTRAQAFRRDGQLSAAREQLRTCMAQSCPALVRDDCSERFDELERVQPTIVFDVTDGNGRDVTAVRIKIDGQPWVDHVDGTALAVNPGSHTFTFEIEGQAPVVKPLVLREGEKARHERVVIGPSSATTPAPAPAPNTPPQALVPAPTAPTSSLSAPPAATSVEAPATPGAENEPAARGPMRALGFAGIGIGAAGIGIGGVAGLLAFADWASAKSKCTASSCSSSSRSDAESDRSTAQTAATVSTVGFVAGGVLLATGIVLVVAAPRSGAPEHGLGIVPVIGSGGAGLQIQGGF